ncbi:3775_t:CDS:2 [Funneliformis mosseae]|uniref:3775_t:CDS:1 n=1 Tax=Funneliformis mosseae TaxID=27381 RepID=A0A9N9DDG4_FUNMO|nr:3775_t:CDS:2 [Funneliformis mosseae]
MFASFNVCILRESAKIRLILIDIYKDSNDRKFFQDGTEKNLNIFKCSHLKKYICDDIEVDSNEVKLLRVNVNREKIKEDFNENKIKSELQGILMEDHKLFKKAFQNKSSHLNDYQGISISGSSDTGKMRHRFEIINIIKDLKQIKNSGRYPHNPSYVNSVGHYLALAIDLIISQKNYYQEFLQYFKELAKSSTFNLITVLQAIQQSCSIESWQNLLIILQLDEIPAVTDYNVYDIYMSPIDIEKSLNFMDSVINHKMKTSNKFTNPISRNNPLYCTLVDCVRGRKDPQDVIDEKLSVIADANNDKVENVDVIIGRFIILVHRRSNLSDSLTSHMKEQYKFSSAIESGFPLSETTGIVFKNQFLEFMGIYRDFTRFIAEGVSEKTMDEGEEESEMLIDD